MSSFEAFTYTELIPHRSLPATSLLRIDRGMPKEALLIRLLLGTVDFHHVLSGQTISQRKNFSILPAIPNTVISNTIFRNLLAPDFKKKDLENYLRTHRSNADFFKNIILEISHYFYQANKKSHTVAFLYLYRALEAISYCFPLIYAARSTNFIGTYKKLKSFFSDKERSELKFFSIFIDNLFSDNLVLLDVPVEFVLTAPDLNIQEIFFDTLSHILTNDRISDSTRPNSIKVKCRDLLGFTVDLRNRYFHFLTGGIRKLNSSEIVEPDWFFSLINDSIANWIAYIYFNILKYVLEQRY